MWGNIFMKLLIVDDEELTRNGLLSIIDKDRFGIETILMADDGVNGLKIAKEERPDIILCDVRMPRLNGIEMLSQIQKELPDIAAIFMSGYSDKEYLMSAIKMGAINYIEKPIDTTELEAAIQKAIEQCMRHKREFAAEEMNTNQAASSLAYYLTMPFSTCKDSVEVLEKQFYKHYKNINKFKYISTIIVKLEAASEASSELQYIYQRLRKELSSSHIHIIYTEKRLFHLVYTIYSDSPISQGSVAMFCDQLHLAFSGKGDYYISTGDIVEGIENAYRSYESAVILLQKSFFFEPCTVMKAGMKSSDKSSRIPEIISKFNMAIDDSNEDEVLSVLSDLYDCCRDSTSLLPNQIKTYYFNLFAEVYNQREKNQLFTDLSIENNESIMDIMDRCFSYNVLHELLLNKVKAFFSDISSNISENKTIYLIKNYISSHYSDSNLSVKDISDYAHLSVSYLCTFFKSETGTTLNQYITEYRMDKAKQLLVDPRNKITEISFKVGYNDGNYFGKSFKKIVGLSPSEYREKVMR